MKYTGLRAYRWGTIRLKSLIFPTFLAGFILGTNPYVRPISGAVRVREKSLTGIKRAFADVTGRPPGRDHWAGAHLVGCGT
jgi:hypothetical protein